MWWKRSITLLSVISKWYEYLILARAEEWILSNIDPLQGAGQKGCYSLMTTLLVREGISHNREGGNDVYVVLLDAKKAFDKVWIDGLFHQLYLQKIDFGLWHILRSYYKGFQCCVRVGGVHSDWFPILQGVLQGGVLSMCLYQIFINPMLIQLKESGSGCCIGDINCTAPSLADDVTLVALHKKSMQMLLDIANDYRCKWRYMLSILKCVGLSYTSSKKGTVQHSS